MAPAPDGDIARLIEIMRILRTPVTGCPWDLAQDFASIAPYTIEEAYEVAEAARRGDMLDLRDELGDLLLQVVFHAQMAEERGAFAFSDVVAAINAKLVRRHPHIFGAARDLTPDQVEALWDEIKAHEKAQRRAERGQVEEGSPSVLDGVSAGLPPLSRARELQKRAASVGFDWAQVQDILAKVREEVDENERALADGDADAIQDEIGDLFFAAVNLARRAGVDAEDAIAGANKKFERRFREIEASLTEQGRRATDSSPAELDRLWAEAKQREKV